MSVAAYDDLVTRMIAANVAPDAARRYAADKYPAAARKHEQASARHAGALEKDEQRRIVRLYREFGFAVYQTSQTRPSKISLGIPDLWVMHADLPLAWWHEVKRAEGGRFSEAQLRFRAECARAGVVYVAGDYRAAEEHLINLGLAYVDARSGVLEPIRRTAECQFRS